MKIHTRLFIACMLTSNYVAAEKTDEIYKCIDADARVSYSDKPCKGKSIIFKTKAPKTNSKVKARPGVNEGVERRKQKTQRLLQAYEAEREQKKQADAVLKAEKRTTPEELYPRHEQLPEVPRGCTCFPDRQGWKQGRFQR